MEYKIPLRISWFITTLIFKKGYFIYESRFDNKGILKLRVHSSLLFPNVHKNKGIDILDPQILFLRSEGHRFYLKMSYGKIQKDSKMPDFLWENKRERFYDNWENGNIIYKPRPRNREYN